MKKYLSIVLVFLLTVSLFAGCGESFNADKTTVFVQKKGTVLSMDVEKFDKEYYSETELVDYIKNQVENYRQEHGKTVSMEDITVKGDTAKLTMKYDSCGDYVSFNGIELYSGNVVKAQAEGYDFDTEFASVTDGEKSKAAQEDVLASDDYKVVAIKANMDVKVDGTILFVSDLNTEIKSKDTVSITGKEAHEEAELTYIIYK